MNRPAYGHPNGWSCPAEYRNAFSSGNMPAKVAVYHPGLYAECAALLRPRQGSAGVVVACPVIITTP